MVLARFIPIVRTALNPLAGAIRVPFPTFTLWQVVGGLAWSVGLTLAGYGLGSRISNIDRYLLPVVALIVAVSLIPVAIELLRRRGGKAPAGKEDHSSGRVPADSVSHGQGGGAVSE